MKTADLFDEESLSPKTLAPPPPLATSLSTDSHDDESVALDHYAQRAYLEYAISVVKGRALPELADGQKPVQRRILYAMHVMGLAAQAKPVKSARVVGEILGKYHPHGDSSAYEALVRMAQDFSLRYPLIDGQGNFGSRDGDSAAAMRYTEARLTPIAELLLAELDMGTVDFIPNYDGAFSEPTLLPARLPLVLLNGASGIAVGLATDIPPHNLSEVINACIALIQHPTLSTAELMKWLPGPDFPGGGQLISAAEDICAHYESGKGVLRIRARWKVEYLAHGQWRIIVTELPPGSSAQKVLAEIEEATHPKMRAGKKILSAEQQHLKSLMLTTLERVRDESDHSQTVRLVFEPKSCKHDPDDFMQFLLAHTSLESNVALNLVMIGLDGRPQQKNLKNILSEWLAFRHATITRRLSDRLERVNARLHILAGRRTAFLHIDAVIKIIRDSDEPKIELMQAFELTAEQANDILEIKLRQLARLEGFKLEKELSTLETERSRLQEALASDSAKNQMMIKELQDDQAKYSDARRTLIRSAPRASLVQTVLDEAITLIVSQNGWIHAKSGHKIDLATLSFKDGDALKTQLEIRSVWPIIVLDNHGRAYTLHTADIPTGRTDGVPIASLIELEKGAAPETILSAPPHSQYVLATSSGYGFIANIDTMVSRFKTGKTLMTLAADDTILPPLLLPVEHPLEPYFVAYANNGNLLAFALNELRVLSKGRGSMLMQLKKGEQLSMIGVVHGHNATIRHTLRGKQRERKLALSDYLSSRGSRGQKTGNREQKTDDRRQSGNHAKA